MLKLVNSMSGEKEEFRPREGNRVVKIFTCGPSIYRRPHIGNYRSFLYEDILLRYLEYLGYEAKRIINFTDVEDKTLHEAESQNRSIEEVTRGVAKHFYDESKLLGIKLPPTIPSSSTSVKEAAEICRKLIEKGYAYKHEADVFFDPLKFEGFGKLFGLDMSRWPKKRIRFKKDTYVGRRWNLGDFILWHGYKDGDTAAWDSVVGKGRPSWNVQDPAMIIKHLGPTVDINCGGIDNIYRHHDYNIAVMESLTGKEYAKYYLHGEHLIVDGKPMSKSLGNILYPEDVIKGKIKPRHLRFFLIYTHYRKKLNFNEKNFQRSNLRLDKFLEAKKQLLQKDSRRTEADPEVTKLIANIKEEFEANMNDDLSVRGSFDAVYALLSRLERLKEKSGFTSEQTKNLERALRDIDQVWGVIF
jgi:cysteinyl-tRNA synthetase